MEEEENFEDDDDEDERAAMLVSDRRRRAKEQQQQQRRKRQDSEASRKTDGSTTTTISERPWDEEEVQASQELVGTSLAGGSRIPDLSGTPPPRLVSVRDTSGRDMPVAERAPVPKRTVSS